MERCLLIISETFIKSYNKIPPHTHTQFSSVQPLRCVQLFATPWTAANRASLSSPAPGACSNSCPLSWWCHPTISSSVIPFSCLQSVPAPGSFPMSQFFTSGGQSIGVSSSLSVLPVNIQDWFPWGLTGSPCSTRSSQESSPTPQFKSINSLVSSFLYSPFEILCTGPFEGGGHYLHYLHQ